MSKPHKARQKDSVSSAQKGSDFERDLQKVYESMLNQDLVDAKVERRAKLKDSEGREHEIDLYWKFTRAGVEHQVVVQARDWASKIKLGHMMEFHMILELLPGQPVGLFITRTGFQKGALNYANDHGIGVLTFRKPSDYEPGKKPEDVVFARLTAEKTRISTSLDCLLNFDLIGKEKRSLVTGEDLARATNLVKSKIASGSLDFFIFGAVDDKLEDPAIIVHEIGGLNLELHDPFRHAKVAGLAARF